MKRKNKLNKKGTMKNVSLEREYVDNLKEAKEDRITAQYNVSEEFEKRKARGIIGNAKAFVDTPRFVVCVNSLLQFVRKQTQILGVLKNPRHAPDFSPRVLDIVKSCDVVR